MTSINQLFTKQQKIYPRRVWGKYRKLKWVAMILLLGIYYFVPWLRWDRGEHAPGQAVLIDIPHTRAYFFGIEIWPQEVYYITGILILAAIGLFFVTSLFGRIWCGYACPQTVWVDLFVWVERIVQGDRNARQKLDVSPWNIEKCYKKFLTHLIWLIIALCTGGAWVFYFNDAYIVMDQILHFELPWSVGGWVAGLTVSTYLMAGFAREQVCTYMCPYARFQSAMFDKDTLIISYDEARGEPRGHYKQGSSMEGRGHCIDCNSCVVVCPMGIDIREGLQMECIACGLCVDACNNVMEKIGLPKGLIRYDTLTQSVMRQRGEVSRFALFRPRTFYYLAILLIVSLIMVYSLLTREPHEFSVLHDRNPLFVVLTGGDIRNGYTINVLNKTHEDRLYRLEVEGLKEARVRIQGVKETSHRHLEVFADSSGHFRIFITAPKQAESRTPITFILMEAETQHKVRKESVFVSENQ